MLRLPFARLARGTRAYWGTQRWQDAQLAKKPAPDADATPPTPKTDDTTTSTPADMPTPTRNEDAAPTSDKTAHSGTEDQLSYLADELSAGRKHGLEPTFLRHSVLYRDTKTLK